jgi:hypothetical protein
MINGIVQSVVFTGTSARIKIRKDSQTLEVITSFDAASRYREGDRIQVRLPAQKLWVCLVNADEM